MSLIRENGKKFTAVIDGVLVKGVVSVVGSGVYLCQNEMCGAWVGESRAFGYKHSWSVGNGDAEHLRSNRVENFILGGSRFVYNRLRTLCMDFKLYESILETITFRLNKITYTAKIVVDYRSLFGTVVNIPKIPRLVKDPNSFGVNDEGMITYTMGLQPILRIKGQQPKLIDVSKQIMKPSKFIRLFKPFMEIRENGSFTITPSEAILNRACEVYADKLTPFVLDIKESKDVWEIYQTPTSNLITTGSLGTSCMRAEADYPTKEFLNFYNSVPNLSILYVTDQCGNLCARALKWSNVMSEVGPITFVDRIYADENITQHIKAYALNKGWFHKVAQTFSDDKLINAKNEIVSMLSIDLDVTFSNFKGLPYLDTMNHYKKGKLCSYSYAEAQKGFIKPVSIQTTRMIFNQTCPKCGMHIPNDYRKGNGCFFCTHEDYFSNSVSEDEVEQVIITGEVQYVSERGKEQLKEDYVFVNESLGWVWHRDVQKCPKCGDWIYLGGSDYKIKNGAYYHKKCLNAE